MDHVPILLSHPVPLRHRTRPGVRETISTFPVTTPVRLPRVPDGSMRPRPVPFMDEAEDIREHGGRLWSRIRGLDLRPEGMMRTVDMPLALVRAMLEGAGGRPLEANGLVSLQLGSPLVAHPSLQAYNGSADLGARIGESEMRNAAEDLVPECRAAATAYVEGNLIACGDAVFQHAGLPCLAGIKAPGLAGHSRAWSEPDSWMMTRHDRVADHVRFVGRMQADDEDKRFRYFSDLVAERLPGIAADDGHLTLLANRLPIEVDNLFERHGRRIARNNTPRRTECLRRLREDLRPHVARGLVGCVARERFSDVVRLCHAILGELGDADRHLAIVAVIIRAFAEEVALPALAADEAALAIDAPDLARLADRRPA